RFSVLPALCQSAVSAVLLSSSGLCGEKEGAGVLDDRLSVKGLRLDRPSCGFLLSWYGDVLQRAHLGVTGVDALDDAPDEHLDSLHKAIVQRSYLLIYPRLLAQLRVLFLGT